MTLMPSTGSHTPVLISGGGPVGLSLAIELGLRGVECTVVEPRPEPTRSRPRAKTLNIRTMEHFRRWGLAGRLALDRSHCRAETKTDELAISDLSDMLLPMMCTDR